MTPDDTPSILPPSTEDELRLESSNREAVQKISDETQEQDDRLPQQPAQWLGLMVMAALVGAISGLVGGGFRLSLAWADTARQELVAAAQVHCWPGIGWIVPMGVCGIAGGLALWLTQRFAPRTAGSGIPRVEAVLRMRLRPAAELILPIKFIGGLLSIGCGMALGREGPTVQMGGTIGNLLSPVMGPFLPEPWTLIAAGAGAGLAVAFNAPMAASLFVMEELLHRFSTRVFCATLIACITGTLVLRSMMGNATDFAVRQLGTVPANVLVEYLLLGLACGFVGAGFNVGLLESLELFDRAGHWRRGLKGAAVGTAAGLLAYFMPDVVGGGESLAQLATTQQLAWRLLVLYLLVRVVLTFASYSSGTPGGIFAPILALGALLGNLFAIATSAVTATPTDPAPYAIVAMAACFTAIVRSPLTGVVLLLEMTGGWTLILPMMAASLMAFVVPELLGIPPIYDSLRRRDEALEQTGGSSSSH
jgi:CIC family chloride channel protein